MLVRTLEKEKIQSKKFRRMVTIMELHVVNMEAEFNECCNDQVRKAHNTGINQHPFSMKNLLRCDVEHTV